MTQKRLLLNNLVEHSKERCGNILQLRNIKVYRRSTEILYSYDHSRHRSIGMKPADVNPENESVVWQRLYGDEPSKPNKYKFNVSDQVRISKARRTFKVTYPVGPKRYSPLRNVYREDPQCTR